MLWSFSLLSVEAYYMTYDNFCRLFLLVNLLFTLHIFPSSLPRPPSNCYTSHASSPLPCPHMDVPTPPPHPQPLNSLGPPVFWGLGSSSLNEHRPSRSLLYVCWEPHISWCMLSIWWSSVWEILGVQINWDCWCSYRITLLLSFFQPFLIQRQGSAASVHWLGANNCIWLFQLLVGSFRGQS